MSRIQVVAVLVLAVLAVFGFLARSHLPAWDADDATDRRGDESTSDRRVEPGSEDAAVGTGAESRRPTLFGRAHLRIGVGDVVGRLQDFVTKEPVAGATIHLSGTGYAGERVAVSTESDADGRFRLPSIPAGEDQALEIRRKDENARTLTGLVITAERTLDLGTIWLGEAGTLAGRVLGMDGEGLAGAAVRVLQGRFSEAQIMEDFVAFISTLDREPAPVARGTSEPSGRFHIDGVPPGPITVVARMPGHHQAVRTVAMTKDGATGGPVELRLTRAEPLVGRVVTEDGLGFAGARVGFLAEGPGDDGYVGRCFVETAADGSFRVDVPPPIRELVAIVAAEGFPTEFVEVGCDRSALEFTLMGGARIVLRFVHDDSGDPIPDAAVLAIMIPKGNAGGIGTYLTGVTDGVGRVELVGRPGVVGLVLLQHQELGVSTYSPGLRSDGEGEGTLLRGPATLEIRAGDNEAELRWPRGVVVRGTVTDRAGRPVEGAIVTSGSEMSWPVRGGRTRTDASGVYRLATPAVDPLRVTVEAPGYAQDPETREVQLVAGAVEIEHDVTMLRAARVEGAVVGRGGEPVPGAQVRLRTLEPADENAMAGRQETAFADEGGRFVIEDVVPGAEYAVVGRAAGYVVTHSQRFRVQKRGGAVRAPRLALKPGVAAVGEVRDPYGDAVPGAYVEVQLAPREELYWNPGRRWGVWAELVTNASGRVEVRDLPDGRVTLTARAEGTAAARASIEVSAKVPPTAPVVVQLRPAVTIRGTVVDQHGEVVRSGTVSVGHFFEFRNPSDSDAKDWIPYQSVRMDHRGRFVLRDLPAGVSTTLRLEAEGYRSRAIDVEGRSDDLQLEIRRIDPDIHRRMEALKARQMALYDRLHTTDDASQRQDLEDEIEALQQELHALDVEEEAASLAGAVRDAEER